MFIPSGKLIGTSYFVEAFNGFDPHDDPEAALKFVLNIILMDRRFEDLDHVLREGGKFSGMGGEPSWELDRSDGPHRAYTNWPADARFRAYVDPDGYELGSPEAFATRPDFCRYVIKALHAYLGRHPERAEDQTLQSILATASAGARLKLTDSATRLD